MVSHKFVSDMPVDIARDVKVDCIYMLCTTIFNIRWDSNAFLSLRSQCVM